MRERMALLQVSRSLCLLAVCVVLFVTRAGAAQGDVRLVNGPNPYEGRVEYFNNGVWVGLCRSYVDSEVPMVICRQLGYPVVGAMMFYGPSYGTAPGEIYRGNIYCSGNEASLSGCSITNQDVNCDPVYTLGVSCDTNITVSKTVRLSGSTNQYEGRLEIFYNGIWGTVCRREGDYYISRQINAHVACRELFGQGFGGSYFPAHETPSRFGILQSGAIHRYFVQCKGDENNLLVCPYNDGWYGCDHEQDATLKCFPVPQGCGGILNGSSGTFQSPVYPAGSTFGQDTECVWRITVTPPYRVRLSVTVIGIDKLAGTSNSLYVTDSSGYYIMTSTQGSNVSSLVSSGNVMYVRLTTVKNSTGIKFTASWDTTVPCDQNFTSTSASILSPGYAAAYPPNLDCTYVIQQRAEFRFRMQFYLFGLDEKDNGTCSDFLTVYDGNSESAPKLGGPYCGNTIPPVLNSTQNVVMIKFHSDGNTSSTSRGFYIYCAGQEPEPMVTQLTSDFGTIQSPGYPNLYNNETDYIWNITASKTYKVVILTFSDFVINNCYASHLWIQDFSSSLAQLCWSGIPAPVTSRGHVMYIRFISTPTTSGQSVGKFNASWTTECRQSFTGSTGIITSPEHPGPYPTNLDCTIIISQDPGYFIQLNFTSFQLDPVVNGQCKDYIEARDGSSENSNLIGGKYCGTSLPPPLSSTQNFMLIRFHSDGVTAANSLGFKAIYQSFEKKCEARAMTKPQGNITSPGFPSYFPRNTYCIWTVTVDPGYVIELTFNAFSVGQRNRECSYAYVRLYDSSTVDAANVIDTLCGSGGVPKIATRKNSLTVVLNSFYSSAQTATGFQASYRAIDKRDATVSTSDLFPFGYNQGDMRAKLTGSSMQKVTVDTEFPFGSEKHRDLYIGANGVISIGNPYSWPNLPEDNKVVCAYCAYIDDSDSVGGIFYQLYGEKASDAVILRKVSRDVRDFSHESRTFSATVALVVTWEKVKQGRYSSVNFLPENEIGEATFQLVLVSDGLTSYVVVYYLTGAMTWTYRGSWSYVIMGYSDGRGDDYQPNLYSKTRCAYNMDNTVGNTGRKGLWIYKVGKVPATPWGVCLQWFTRNFYSEDMAARKTGFAKLPSCPCSGRDVWRKVRYLWTWSRTDTVHKIRCYRMNEASSQEVYPYGKECCYSYDESNQLTYEQLIMDPPFAGTALAYNPAIYALRALYEQEDRKAHLACCLSGKHRKLCLFYYHLRPVGVCRADIPFQFAWLWGDPHITTLDGREYIFNGCGEFTLVTLTTPKLTFNLQGRMEQAQLQNGTHFNGTVFTAFGAKENGTSVFVGLHPITKDALEIYVDGQDYSRRFQQEGEQFSVETDKFTIFSDNGSFVTSFPSGITLAVAIGIQSLAVSISLPLEFRSMTRGLLGNFNGVKDDDFVLPNGTVLSNNMSHRDIHFKFGLKWAVTAQNTVLRYGPREGPANFSYPECLPVFLDEISLADRLAAEAVCGSTDNACIYDFVVTGSEAFALDTKRRTEQMRKEIAQSKNTLPDLGVPANVSVTLGEPATFNVTARDPDIGDSVTYKVVDTSGGRITANPASGQITANITNLQPVHVQVYVTDSTNGQSVVRSVPIILCSGCNNHGNCDFTRTRDSNVTFYFQPAVCVCREGWIGDDCDKDRDACLDNPCDPLQTCTDLSPSKQGMGVGYSCSDCPAGYSVATDGSNRCLDVDECSDARLNGCVYGCENTYGSYACSCPIGYRRSSDARSCLDVNECAEKSDNCQQVCSNTEGGFLCQCQPGHTYNSARNTCDQTAATREVCQTKNCSQGCRAITNNSTNLPVPQCFCHAGYDLSPVDGVTCVDHNECQDGLCAQVCTNTKGGFVCSCYSGHLLNNDQRTCSPCPSLTYGPGCSMNCSCSGRAVACHMVTGCVCQEGWTGSECRDDVDECARNPDVCGQGKVCVNNEGSFACTCPPGYELNAGGNCADVDECTTQSQACGDDQKCTNVPGSYFCTCMPGYTALNRSCVDISECSVNGGGCQQHCVNTKGSYNCDCYYGYTLNTDRFSCAKVFEPCSGRTSCGHGCTLDDNDREVCFCHTGYTLQADGRTCRDVDECSTGVANCSHTCNNTQGAFICSCPVGMRLGSDGTTCEDCPQGTYGMNCARNCNCSTGADRCDVITGCVCKAGWSGVACGDDTNECMTSAGQEVCQRRNAECINLLGGYKCVCRKGFAMDNDNNCQDVNECSLDPPCSQECENLPGSYRCLCRKGFSFDQGTGECRDINECLLASTHTCTQRCQNVAGSYRCSCNAGYALANDGHTCAVQTQCTRTDCDSSKGGCIIEVGQEKCFCNIGYVLGSNNVSCTREAVDWCSQGACGQLCQRSADGTTFTCSCTQGHLLNEDGRTCRVCPAGTYGTNCASNCTCNVHHTQSCDPVTGTCNCTVGWFGATCNDDVNECVQTSPPVCPSPKECLNTAGSYVCFCKAGYIQLPSETCRECKEGTYGMNCNQTCSCPTVNVESCDNGNGTCRCKAGWEGDRCDLDINECVKATHNCSAQTHTTCQNTAGSFVCVCAAGYSRNQTGVCVAARRLRFICTILVNFVGDLTPTSGDFQLLRQQAETELFTRLGGVRGLLAIVISSIRRGSIVLEADALVENTDTSSSAASLTLALVGLNGQDLTVGSLTGPAVYSVGSANVSSNNSSCDVFLQFGVCEAQQKCQLVDGTPACQSEKPSDDSTMRMIIGLAVGIPVGIVLVCVAVVACWYLKCVRRKKEITNTQRGTISDSPGELRRDYNPPTGRGKPPRFHSSPYYGHVSKGADDLAFSSVK